MPSPPARVHPIKKPVVGYKNYKGDQRGKTEIIPAGTQGVGWDNIPARAFTEDVFVEYDVEIVLRDGTKIYADFFRPASSLTDGARMPTILSWSPFGKNYGAFEFLPMRPWKVGVHPSDVSGWEKFEGLDPALWCPQGYVIANVDVRGTGHSEGVMKIMGSTDAEDGYDAIEWIAKQHWSNGAVGMAGNSHLAICQYFLAAGRPPALKAIAPWEGCGDLYRQQFNRGGIFSMSNFQMIIDNILRGPEGVDDFEAMYRAEPLCGPFWQDKRPDMSKIEIPVYLEGSDHSQIHVMGTIGAWLEMPSKNKWLRWSGLQEWSDLWSSKENYEDLLAFFDHFLKGVDNGFEKTPRVRMTALRYGDNAPISNIVWPDFPHPETEYRDLFFQPDGKLGDKTPDQPYTISYDSAVQGSLASFKLTFDKTTRVMGLPKAHVFVSCSEHDDMCVWVRIRKLDKNGKGLFNAPYIRERWPVKSLDDVAPADRSPLILHPGSHGQLRASRRHIDHSRSIHPQYPFHTHDRVEKVPPGQIVELEIGIWHVGTHYEAGESLRVDVFGNNEAFPEFADSTKVVAQTAEDNRGLHVIHMGPAHPSRVIIPFVPGDDF